MKMTAQTHAQELLDRVGGGLRVAKVRKLGSLWAGYGEVLELDAHNKGDNQARQLIAKRVSPPAGHGVSHERKLRSYRVEACFYQAVAPQLLQLGRPAIAQPLLAEVTADPSFSAAFVLTDLRDGFPCSVGSLDMAHARAALEWLAELHATYWQQPLPHGLWEEGCFWHLATRLEELQDMPNEWGALRDAAGEVDDQLKNGPRTLVHGDAKAANFLFSAADAAGGVTAAAYDFQYTGGGDGMKDVAYLLCSSVNRAVVDRHETELLRHYHSHLLGLLDEAAAAQYPFEYAQTRFDLALLDFVRFMAGWGWWGATGWAAANAKATLGKMNLH